MKRSLIRSLYAFLLAAPLPESAPSWTTIPRPLILLLVVLLSGGGVGRDLGDWKALLSFRPNPTIQRAVQARGPTWTVHRIEDGSGRVNLDYYPVKVLDLPTVGGRKLGPAELLEHIRTNINKFVDTDLAEFHPYQRQDAATWTSDDPDGTLLLIDIKLAAGVVDLGLVVTSMDSSNEWTFSTVRGGSGYKALNDRKNPGAHPVSGNRSFGYVRSGAAWTFYTRGADRATRPMDEVGGIPVARDFGFEQADKLWRSFQKEVVEYVNRHGGKAEVDGKGTTSGRHDWDTIRRNRRVYDTSNQPGWVPVPPIR